MTGIEHASTNRVTTTRVNPEEPASRLVTLSSMAAGAGKERVKGSSATSWHTFPPLLLCATWPPGSRLLWGSR